MRFKRSLNAMLYNKDVLEIHKDYYVVSLYTKFLDLQGQLVWSKQHYVISKNIEEANSKIEAWKPWIKKQFDSVTTEGLITCEHVYMDGSVTKYIEPIYMKKEEEKKNKVYINGPNKADLTAKFKPSAKTMNKQNKYASTYGA